MPPFELDLSLLLLILLEGSGLQSIIVRLFLLWEELLLKCLLRLPKLLEFERLLCEL